MTRSTTPCLVLIALCLMVSVTLSDVRAQTCPVSGTTTGSITAGDPTQTDRLFRNGVPSDCNGKPSPGLFGGGTFHFDQQSFVNNSGATVCIEITFSATTNMHSVAYLNSFNPANVEQNYLGDLGVVNTLNTPETYSVSVPNGATLVIVTHEATADGGGNYSYTLNCITAPPPLPAPGQLLISEFRLSGPAAGTGSQRDEFIEIYNNTDGPLSIDQVVIQSYDPNFFAPGDGSDFNQGLPPGTVLPARSHFLVADTSAYSLGTYATPDLDTLPLFNGDFFIDNEGIRLVTGGGAVVLDSVGFSGSGGRPGETISYPEGTALPRRTQVAPIVQYSYVRRMTSGLPQDTNNNTADFALVSVTATTFPLAAGGTTQSILGAPGPENTSSPIQRNTVVKPSLVDPGVSGTAAPNRVRDSTPGTGTTAFGTLKFRRKFTNTGTDPVTQIRWRVVDITTLGGITAGQADLRVIPSTSGDFTVSVSAGGTVPVKGTQVQEPPTQTNGGGLNSSIIMITPSFPIMPGASVNIELALGVAGTGNFRFFVNTEAVLTASLPATNRVAPVAEGPAKAGGKNHKQSFASRTPALPPKAVRGTQRTSRQ